MFVEFQIHLAEIKHYNDGAHSHDHYEYFRSLYAGGYFREMDRTLELQLEQFDTI